MPPGRAEVPRTTPRKGAQEPTGSHFGHRGLAYTPSRPFSLLEGGSCVKDRYEIVVIGGGIVGCAVLYHLALRGKTDTLLLEREELTAGSTWHAAGGFHAINADTRVAALQLYTISMYPKVEEESGVDVGLKMSGGLELAGSPERWEWLAAGARVAPRAGTRRRLHRLGRTRPPRWCRSSTPTGIYGALFDPDEGNLDPNGATRAYAVGSTRSAAPTIVEHNRMLGLERLPSGAWRVETEQGPVECEHVVNAGGLWARRIGRMVGVDHPLVPMPHHYLVTDDVPAGRCDRRAHAGGHRPRGVHLPPARGQRRAARRLRAEPTPLGGRRRAVGLRADAVPRGARPDHAGALDRVPAVPGAAGDRDQALGERRVHVHARRQPARRSGRRHARVLGSVRRAWPGFSQGAGIGLALANWIVDGDPGVDAFGMDVARFGDVREPRTRTCARPPRSSTRAGS